MRWEFTAQTPDELALVQESLPEKANGTVAGELHQIVWLLKALAKNELVEYPFVARHTGERSVPDFQLQSGSRRISLEMAKVTSGNLEHARSLRAKMPDPPSHFTIDDLCDPESLARKLKAGKSGWPRFVAGGLPQECREWLDKWNEHDAIPDHIKELCVAMLNSIVDGPPIANHPDLEKAIPKPQVMRVEDFPSDETPRHRKSWLEDAFWEELRAPLNQILMVSPFVRLEDKRMKRPEVLQKGFMVPGMTEIGPTIEEERIIWVKRMGDEITDKTKVLARQVFCHGEEDWLILWDRLGTPRCDANTRAEMLVQRLDECWKPDWFSKVFVQEEHFEWQLMFSSDAVVRLS